MIRVSPVILTETLPNFNPLLLHVDPLCILIDDEPEYPESEEYDDGY